MLIKELHQMFINSSGVTTDSRNLKEHCLFFALKGIRFNGNEFAQNAIKKGASYAIIDDKRYESKNTILVDDVLRTLQKLSTFHRKFLNIPIIALTGSNGKTTSKELIKSVLSKKFNTVATKGNLNNHIGVPLTLLSMNDKTELGIIEMGANHLGEINALCNIAYPDYGYITNFGKAHLEGFGGVEGVIKGKSELYEHLKKHKKFIFYHYDDTLQLKKLKNYNHTLSFGSAQSTIPITLINNDDAYLSVQHNKTVIKSKLTGVYNYTNLACAISIGIYFKVAEEAIKTAIENYIPKNNRSQIITKGTIQIILDAYNANPSSMEAAIKNFSLWDTSHKTLILGDMYELGEYSRKEHQKIADLTEQHNFNKIILIGSHFYNTSTKAMKFKTFDNFKQYAEKNIDFDGSILIKGSRGMALERVLEII